MPPSDTRSFRNFQHNTELCGWGVRTSQKEEKGKVLRKRRSLCLRIFVVHNKAICSGKPWQAGFGAVLMSFALSCGWGQEGTEEPSERGLEPVSSAPSCFSGAVASSQGQGCANL